MDCVPSNLTSFDRSLLDRFFALRENLDALARETGGSLLDLHVWAASPAIAAFIDLHRHHQAAARREAALSTLESILRISENPIELRRAAYAFLRWSDPPRPRPQATPAPEGHAVRPTIEPVEKPIEKPAMPHTPVCPSVAAPSSLPRNAAAPLTTGPAAMPRVVAIAEPAMAGAAAEPAKDDTPATLRTPPLIPYLGPILSPAPLHKPRSAKPLPRTPGILLAAAGAPDPRESG